MLQIGVVTVHESTFDEHQHCESTTNHIRFLLATFAEPAAAYACSVGQLKATGLQYQATGMPQGLRVSHGQKGILIAMEKSCVGFRVLAVQT